MLVYAGFDHDRHAFLVGTLPEHLRFAPEAFDAQWDHHPADYHEITMFGRPIRTPRY